MRAMQMRGVRLDHESVAIVDALGERHDTPPATLLRHIVQAGLKDTGLMNRVLCNLREGTETT